MIFEKWLNSILSHVQRVITGIGTVMFLFIIYIF